MEVNGPVNTLPLGSASSRDLNKSKEYRLISVIYTVLIQTKCKLYDIVNED